MSIPAAEMILKAVPVRCREARTAMAINETPRHGVSRAAYRQMIQVQKFLPLRSPASVL